MERRKYGLTMVYVRGKMYEFTPAIINQMFLLDHNGSIRPMIHTGAPLDEIATLLSGGSVSK